MIPIALAPLRQRREDILPLAKQVLARHAAETGCAFTLSRGATIEPEDLLLSESTLGASPAPKPRARSGSTARRSIV